jgi:hypothetical protein
VQIHSDRTMRLVRDRNVKRALHEMLDEADPQPRTVTTATGKTVRLKRVYSEGDAEQETWWEFAKRMSAEVAKWPAWKRGGSR